MIIKYIHNEKSLCNSEITFAQNKILELYIKLTFYNFIIICIVIKK